MKSIATTAGARQRSGMLTSAAVLAPLLLAAPAAAQGAIRGTVHAPPGEDIRGAVVIACFREHGRCDYARPHPNSRAVGITTGGPSARFVLDRLAAGEYEILGTRDVNGNGREDAGDWIAQYEAGGVIQAVRPPAERVELRFTVKPAAAPTPTAPTPASGRRRDPSAVPAAPGRGGLSGIYHGVTRSPVAPGPGSPVASGLTWTPERDWMTFFPDGRVFLALPPLGIPGFDWSVECPPHPTWCATYTVEGSRVTIRWASGQTKMLTRAEDGTLWTSDRLNYLHLPPLDGLRLEGTYFVPWKEQYGPVRIAFARDGRFEEERLLGGISWNSSDYGAPAAAIRDVPRGAGRYEIRSNTLTLHYRDGRVVSVNLYVFPDELRKRQPEEIYINSFDFRRRP